MKLGLIKQRACGMMGDTTQRSRLYTTWMADIVNDVIIRVLAEVRSKTKDCPFLKSETTITYVTDTTDYLLPADFMEAFRVTIGHLDNEYPMAPTDNETFLKVQSSQITGRDVFTVYWDKPTKRWRIRFNWSGSYTPTDFTVHYKCGHVKVYNDEDEIEIFPEDQGWDTVLIHGSAADAYMYYGEGLNEPKTNFEELLAKRIASLNSDTPDRVETINLSEFDKARIEETWARY